MESVTGNDGPSARIHSSRSAEAVAARRKSAFFSDDAPAIPNAFHYESARQGQLWQEVARKYQPKNLESFYRSAFAGLKRVGFTGKGCHLVGLGAGGARKERWLLEEAGDCPCRWFTPVDVSESLALESARHLRDLAMEPVQPLVADVEAAEDLRDWLDGVDGVDGVDGGAGRRWFTAFGLTPNSEPGVLLPRLRGLLRQGDRLLVSANLLPGGNIESVRGEYDNPETRAWLQQVLVESGIEDFLGDMEFRATRIDGVEALAAWVRWKRDGTPVWGESPFRARRGEELRIFFTLRYTREGFVEALESRGLAVERSWESPCGREGLCLARLV